MQNLNTKMISDFDCKSSVNISSLPVNKSDNVKVMTRFFFRQNAYVCKIIAHELHLQANRNLLFPKQKSN